MKSPLPSGRGRSRAALPLIRPTGILPREEGILRNSENYRRPIDLLILPEHLLHFFNMLGLFAHQLASQLLQGDVVPG